MTLVSVTAYHSFGGEVEASNTPTIRRLTPSCRHQLPRIAPLSRAVPNESIFWLILMNPAPGNGVPLFWMMGVWVTVPWTFAPCQSNSAPTTTDPICQLAPIWPPANAPLGLVFSVCCSKLTNVAAFGNGLTSVLPRFQPTPALPPT